MRWGQRSFDEMGDLWFQLATDSDADRARLRGEVQAKMTAEDLIGLDTMLASAPGDTELHDDAGVLALLLGRPAVAVSHFRVTAERRPTSAAAHYNLGTALTSAGLFDDAIASYERALQLEPALRQGAQQPGRHADGDGPRSPRRCARYEAAVALDPSMPESRNNLGAALWRRGDYARAERELREALRLRPGYAEAYFNLGHLAMRTGDVPAAAAPFPSGGRRLEPDWVLALDHRRLGAGDRRRRRRCGRRPRRSRSRSAPSALTGRQDARALDVLAVALASAGRFDEAVRTAREALGKAAPPLTDGHRRAAARCSSAARRSSTAE